MCVCVRVCMYVFAYMRAGFECLLVVQILLGNSRWQVSQSMATLPGGTVSGAS